MDIEDLAKLAGQPLGLCLALRVEAFPLNLKSLGTFVTEARVAQRLHEPSRAARFDGSTLVTPKTLQDLLKGLDH